MKSVLNCSFTNHVISLLVNPNSTNFSEDSIKEQKCLSEVSCHAVLVIIITLLEFLFLGFPKEKKMFPHINLSTFSLNEC